MLRHADAIRRRTATAARRAERHNKTRRDHSADIDTEGLEAHVSAATMAVIRRFVEERW